MDRTARCELLARLPDQDLINLANLVIDPTRDQLIQLTPPTIGMIMARVEDGAHGEVFNFGEVLVTECLVQLGQTEGWSMLMGSRPQGALAAAGIDAATANNHPATPELDNRLATLIAQQDALLAAERTQLAATRVQFDTQ